MRNSFRKIFSVILLVSYLAISANSQLQLLQVFSNFSHPVLSGSKALPFASKDSRSFKPSFKHFPPQVNNFSPLFDCAEVIKITSAPAVRTIHFFEYNNIFLVSLLHSEGLRSPPYRS